MTNGHHFPDSTDNIDGGVKMTSSPDGRFGARGTLHGCVGEGIVGHAPRDNSVDLYAMLTLSRPSLISKLVLSIHFVILVDG
mmetsp:Transcript_21703/g.30184  ORF Transcript_21703/g.30184 Transcript_21703/m.30184 type:complete len:82 (+) Transcript_21703:438-683(+)